MTDDELRAFQARAAQYEAPIIAAVLAWIARIQRRLTLDQVAAAIEAGSAHGLFATIRSAGQVVLPIEAPAVDEAQAVAAELDRPGFHFAFNLQDPNFTVAVEEHGARAIREIDGQTEQAVRTLLTRARRLGTHPRQLAYQVRDIVGLTTRQANAALNLYAGLLEAGRSTETAAARATAYARQLRLQRARTIARTETIRAANIGRIASYEQAATNGLFMRDRAMLEWMAVQQDPAEICFQLDGTRVPLGSDFDGLLPPAHPNCRCVVTLVLV